MQASWQYKLQIFRLHFISLVCADRRLQRKKMFVFYTISFRQHLSPAVFAC